MTLTDDRRNAHILAASGRALIGPIRAVQARLGVLPPEANPESLAAELRGLQARLRALALGTLRPSHSSLSRPTVAQVGSWAAAKLRIGAPKRASHRGPGGCRQRSGAVIE